MDGGKHEPSDAGLPARRLAELLESQKDEGISQALVARRANVPPQYLSDVRNGRRPMTELFARRLGEEFNYNFLWLLGQDDSPERVTALPSTSTTISLPMISEAVAGDPRDHPHFKGATQEVAGVVAVKARRAVQPYIWEIDYNDRAGRFRKGDLILVSQSASENFNLCLVRCGETIQLARKKGAKWLRADSGEPLHGECEVTGHCVGVIWSSLI